MIDPSILIGFALVSLVLNITPGPDIVYAVSRSASRGPRAAVACATGHLLGSVVHTVFVVVGLSAILVASSTAFTIVKIAGAAYLVYLGIRAILNGTITRDTTRHAAASGARVAREAFIIHTLNPKTAAFFLAFLPQFVTPEHHVPTQLAILGLWFTVQAALIVMLFGLAAAHVGARWRPHAQLTLWLRRTVGAIFIALGARLALTP